ncbi:Threonine aldolase [Parvibaculum lavamentivorans DS-1]|uniref:L-threonine aldolase n=1 Tax=Parvibaculum lavamentivorans (strain DS-1 / DSM 13023 / NCIMB 13966) TaxID=402881 RepID=A7HUJ8_PARL1|nr:low specificity L-threonine aldolase [Parvibaculum lavamentivorans]ABS63581.1 Threonine aldolase [Parvibaculum lavamentivorans DS-1]
MDFTSDNAAGAAPEILEALSRVNGGTAASYGADDVTTRLTRRFSELFEREVAVFPVVTGTAANALALATLTPSHGAVMCHELAHVHVDECGAPEMFSGGAKLVPVGGAAAKIDPRALAASLAALPQGVVHHVQPSALTVTQSTEMGSVYSIAEIEALAEIARGRGLRIHMDGARFANALASLEVSPASMTWKAGIDIMSFGATKNGALAAEAVLVFNPDLAKDLAFRRKRAGHLLSKMRFLSAQLEAYLTDDLWLRLAAHANAMTTRLAAGLAQTAGATLHLEPQANEVFVRLPVSLIKHLRDAGARFHPWPMPGDDDQARSVRLVTSFQTSAAEIDSFLGLAAG